MFTGLIQGIGQLQSLSAGQLTIKTESGAILTGLALGDSIAVDGICLTVEAILDNGFTVTTSPETLQRSTLNDAIRSNWPVNLEPALRVGDRLGGHFVTGHVDGLGKVVDIITSETAWTFTFEAPAAVARLIVEKGSIAVNGISLTVADCDPDGSKFSAAVIPHSFGMTTLSQLEVGRPVNLETDVLGKYVDRLLGAAAPASAVSNAQQGSVSLAFLMEHGYH
ncbi:MAG: riboflavin synthase [Cyanobacteria bacterium P01_F01_bin.42]